MTFWGSTTVGIDRLAAFRDVDVLCFDHGNEREMQKLMSTPLWQAMPFVREQRFQRFRQCGSTVQRFRPCILPVYWMARWEAKHEFAYRAFSALLLTVIFLVALALTGFNLSTALPRGQWGAALVAPDIDNIQQMLFHYSLLPRLAISLLVGQDWGWWASYSSRSCVTTGRANHARRGDRCPAWDHHYDTVGVARR
jgi:hypothetical protein